MPLKATKRKGSPHYQITGSIEGYGRVRESAGTDSKREAEALARKRENEILTLLESQGYKTVSDAIIEYIENGHDGRFLGKINKYLGLTRLDEINQEVIDRAARLAYPPYRRGEKGEIRHPKKSTIKRQFYTPLSAVLHYAYDLGWMPYIRVKMPKVERPAPKWADEKWFNAFLPEATDDLARLVIFLMGTGCRISEALNLAPTDVHLDRGEAYVRTTKNGEPRMAHLPDFVSKEIKPLVEENKDRVFHMYKDRFEVNSAIKRTCKKAKVEYLSSHQVGSHTFATNLARLAGMDARALTATGRWKDPKSTHHYTHYLKREESAKADVLGVLIKGRR